MSVPGTVLYAGPTSTDVSGDTEGWTFTGVTVVEALANPHNAEEAVGLRITGDGATVGPTILTNLMPVELRDVLEMSGWVMADSGTLSIGRMRLLAYDEDGVFVSSLESRTPTIGALDTWEAMATRRYRVPTGIAYVALEFTVTGTPAATVSYTWDDVLLRIALSPMILDKGDVDLAGPGAAVGVVSTFVDLDLGVLIPPPAMLYVDVGGGHVALPYLVPDAASGVLKLWVAGFVQQVTSPDRTRVLFQIAHMDGVDWTGFTFTLGWTLFEMGADT